MYMEDVRKTFETELHDYRWRGAPMPKSPFSLFPIGNFEAVRVLERYSRLISPFYYYFLNEAYDECEFDI